MKFSIKAVLITFFLFGASLLIGVIIFTAISFGREFGQAPHKLTYILSIPEALVFMTGAALLIYWMPGFFSALFSGLFLATKLGKIPELALFSSSLIGFYTFKGFFLLTPYLFGSSGNQSLNETSFGLAACGFGLSACATSFFLIKTEVKPDKSQRFLLSRTVTSLLVFLAVIIGYFHFQRV